MARLRRKKIDPRQVEAIAYVVDSSGEPVIRTEDSGKFKTGTKIGIYRQETSLPDQKKGIHYVWASDEEYGDRFPYKKGDPVPYHLIRFMKEATSGRLSATYRLTEWGRLLADTVCKCNTGRRLEEATWTPSKKDERMGMNSKEWKAYMKQQQKK